MTSTPTRPVDNVVIATKGLQDRNINTLAGTTVENKGKLILTKDKSTHHPKCHQILDNRHIFVNQSTNVIQLSIPCHLSYIKLE